MVPHILGVEGTLAKGKAADQRAGTFLAQYVAVRHAVGREYLLDHRGEPARCGAEELMPGIENLLGRIGLAGRSARRQCRRCRSGHGKQHRGSHADQVSRKEPAEHAFCLRIELPRRVAAHAALSGRTHTPISVKI